jgi:hypothetical protein
VATVFSLVVLFSFRKQFQKIFAFDLIFLATIAAILIINMILGAGMNLKAPYNNAIKYDYLALPFFCLIAASLVAKSLSLVNFDKLKTKLNRAVIVSVVAASIALIAATILASFSSAHQLALSDYLLFKARLDQDVGYSLFNHTPPSQTSLLIAVQYVGFIVVLSGLLWMGRHKLAVAFKPKRCWIEAKKAQNKKPIFNT